MFQQAYGEDFLSRTQCHEWYQRFKSGRTSVEDDPIFGRPSTSMDDDQNKPRNQKSLTGKTSATIKIKEKTLLLA